MVLDEDTVELLQFFIKADEKVRLAIILKMFARAPGVAVQAITEEMGGLPATIDKAPAKKLSPIERTILFTAVGGRKIQAIKMWRAEYNTDLRTAKEAVERMVDDYEQD